MYRVLGTLAVSIAHAASYTHHTKIIVCQAMVHLYRCTIAGASDTMYRCTIDIVKIAAMRSPVPRGGKKRLELPLCFFALFFLVVAVCCIASPCVVECCPNSDMSAFPFVILDTPWKLPSHGCGWAWPKFASQRVSVVGGSGQLQTVKIQDISG